ncbi:MAG: hypothetical protein JW940_17475 [Polyangiaceae bacterium]|nr:hypothetical protein [Polyangiaceae bacterium]
MTYADVSRVGWVVVVALLAGGCSPKHGGADEEDKCPSFTVCGGIPDGNWQLDYACFDAEVSGAFGTRWPHPSCRDAIKAGTLTMTGTLSFAGGSLTWNVTTSQTWRGVYSTACMSEMQGAPVSEVDKVQCLVQQGWLDSPGIFSSVSCGVLDQSCDCSMSYSGTNTSTVPHTIQEATISFADGTPSAEFCADKDTLLLRQADSVSGLPVNSGAHRI